MQLALTTMSENGQIVIPSQIRREAKLKQGVRFMVVHKKGTILLKQVRETDLVALYAAIDRAEADLAAGRYKIVDTNMPFEQADKILRS